MQSVGKRKIQQAEQTDNSAVRVSLGRRFFKIVGVVVLLGIASFAAVHFVSGSQAGPAKPPSVSVREPSDFKQPATFAELTALKPEAVGAVDIGLMNLLCAEGLPGAENLDVGQCLTNLDQWAQDLRLQIDRNFHRYQENPGYFYNSTNFYKMVMMASILYSQYNIRYNPQRIETPAETRPDDHFFADSRDILIHGLLGSERMGTCSSMPVLYVALGRRLGYPVKLVATKGHFFLRWDSPSERFDMDGTQKGMNKYDDEHYKQWPIPVTDEEIKTNGFLKSMTPAQELSTFLATRAACLEEAGKIRDAIAAHAAALRFEPNLWLNQAMLNNAEEKCFGFSAAELRADSHPEFQDPEMEATFNNGKEIKLKQIERAELGLPNEVSLPKFNPQPIP